MAGSCRFGHGDTDSGLVLRQRGAQLAIQVHCNCAVRNADVGIAVCAQDCDEAQNAQPACVRCQVSSRGEFGMSENSWTGCVETLWRARHGKGMSRFNVASVRLETCFKHVADVATYIPRASIVWSLDMAGKHGACKGDTVFVKGITTTGQVLFRHSVPAKVKTALSVVHTKCGKPVVRSVTAECSACALL